MIVFTALVALFLNMKYIIGRPTINPDNITAAIKIIICIGVSLFIIVVKTNDNPIVSAYLRSGRSGCYDRMADALLGRRPICGHLVAARSAPRPVHRAGGFD